MPGSVDGLSTSGDDGGDQVELCVRDLHIARAHGCSLDAARRACRDATLWSAEVPTVCSRSAVRTEVRR